MNITGPTLLTSLRNRLTQGNEPMQSFTLITLYAVTILAPFTTLKYYDIQFSEFFLPFFAFLALNRFFLEKGGIVSGPIKRLFFGYLIFLAVVLVVSLSQSWLLNLEALSEFGLLKRPYWISLSRVVQIGYGALVMLLGMNFLRNNQATAERMASLYLSTGYLVCLFSVINYHLSRYGLNILLPGQEPGMLIGSGRADGTFIEPGPFGLYALSLMALLGIRINEHRLQSSLMWGLILYALYLSASKAAGITIALLFITYLVTSGIVIRHRSLAALGIALATFLTYRLASVYVAGFQTLSVARSATDGGRFMAMHLLPKMILSHPFTGIGLGNYPLLRDKMATVEGLPHFGWDLHGMGLLGLGVELGLPLLVIFCALLLRPMSMPFLCQLNPFKKCLLYFQPLAYMTGLQPNFIYPWIFTAIATSIVFHEQREAYKEAR